jgi:hypothetical protein
VIAVDDLRGGAQVFDPAVGAGAEEDGIDAMSSTFVPGFSAMYS